MNFFLLLIISTSLFASESFEKKRWNHINNLISKEMKTINQVKKKPLSLQYRLFELMSERIKLHKEKENKAFIIKKLPRKIAFKKSLSLLKETNRYGHSILKKYPNSRYTAAIYYTMALNIRDYSLNKSEYSYLIKALNHSKSSHLNHLIRTSLAEYHYNKKNYKKAVRLYSKVIRKRNDEWLTKNLFNYGWCLFKTKKFNLAIDYLEESYNLSKAPGYINVEEQVMNSLISFYVFAKDVPRGIKFISSNVDVKKNAFFKFAKKTASKGFYKETEQLLNLVYNEVDSKKDIELLGDISLFEIDFYQQFNQNKKLLSIASKIKTQKLNDYQKEDAITKISNIVGNRQVIFKKNYSKHEKTFNEDKLDEIIQYFSILIKLDKVNETKYQYFIAETQYGVESYLDSISTYKKSIATHNPKIKENDFREKSLDAIFAAISALELKDKDLFNHLEYAYTKYLDFWPKSKKSNDIYPRLFLMYLKNKDYQKSSVVLDRFVKNHKNLKSKQKELLKQKIDFLISNNEIELFAKIIRKLENNFLRFSKNEIKKSKTILANLLFNKYKIMDQEKKYDDSFKGYQSIYFSENYPMSIRADAAFNAAMIKTKSQDNTNAIKWYKKAFAKYNKKEKSKKRTFLEKMALRTQLQHNFLASTHLHKFIINHFCHEKEKNLPLFKNLIYADMANDYIMKVNFSFSHLNKCINEIPSTLHEEYLTYLIDNQHEAQYFSHISQYKLKHKFSDSIKQNIEDLVWKYYRKDYGKQARYLKKLKLYDKKLAKKINKTHYKLNKFNDAIDAFYKSKIQITSKMTPEIFNKKLEQRFKSLGSIVTMSDSILSNGLAHISVITMDQITQLTDNFSKEIMQYELPIKDQEFQKQFKNQMKQISFNIHGQSIQYKKNSQKLVEKYQILTNKRTVSHQAWEVLNISDIRPQPAMSGMTFDLE